MKNKARKIAGARPLKTKPLKKSKQAEVETLFAAYLDICNKAIEKNKEHFPYKNLLSASEKLLNGHPIDLAVYDDEPKAKYSITFKDKKLKCLKTAPKEPEKAWRVKLSYLKQVVKNPETYINHPARLDIDWLKSRLGF